MRTASISTSTTCNKTYSLPETYRVQMFRGSHAVAKVSGDHMRHFFSSSALVTTLTELSAIAAPATTGLR